MNMSTSRRQLAVEGGSLPCVGDTDLTSCFAESLSVDIFKKLSQFKSFELLSAGSFSKDQEHAPFIRELDRDSDAPPARSHHENGSGEKTACGEIDRWETLGRCGKCSSESH